MTPRRMSNQPLETAAAAAAAAATTAATTIENSSFSPPPHTVAQKLNNRGAQYIEAGNYGNAISCLIRALKLSERINNDHESGGDDIEAKSSTFCSCYFCSLDACLSCNCRCGDGQQEPPVKHHHHGGGGYIYSKPIYVSEISLYQGHNMGITLSLIVIFNLALAHHLTALQEEEQRRPRSPEQDYSSLSLAFFGKAMHLYELAYQLQLDEQHGDQVSSLRFTMIIANNLGEVHRLASDDKSKYIMCLRHLLSTMMYLIDFRFPPDYIELDGFWRNASPLILQQRCASAA